jgi:Protein of unknown function (DUF4058)
MPNPFPGMDPFIEKPAIWPDFHNRMVTYICDYLQPLLQPRYASILEDRLYVVESDRPIRPDVSIVRTNTPREAQPATVAVMETGVDAPAVFEMWREEIRQPLVKIIEPTAGNRVVTAIEVLSPDNKQPGVGRENYLKKREEYWESGTSLVEIDLLRGGQPTVRLNPEQFASIRPYRHLIVVTRRWPSRHEVYAFPLEKRLPRISLPLASDDHDLALDMQQIMDRCWTGGPYPALLRYDADPPSDLTPAEQTWCRERLQAMGK